MSSPRPSSPRDLDESKFTPADREFLNRHLRQAQLKMGICSVVGGGGLYAAARASNGSRGWRVAGAVFGVMGGLSAGLLSTSYAFVQDLPSLPQDSQVKAFGARILRDKYPMATADWDQQQQRREGGK